MYKNTPRIIVKITDTDTRMSPLNEPNPWKIAPHEKVAGTSLGKGRRLNGIITPTQKRRKRETMPKEIRLDDSGFVEIVATKLVIVRAFSLESAITESISSLSCSRSEDRKIDDA
jgi:hypothetical protein